MAQSLARLITHIIFSTKHRRATIIPEIRPELKSYLGGILRQLKSPLIEINCVADHVHILCCLSKNFALAKLMEEVKKGSSKWVKTKAASL